MNAKYQFNISTCLLFGMKLHFKSVRHYPLMFKIELTFYSDFCHINVEIENRNFFPNLILLMHVAGIAYLVYSGAYSSQ